MPALSLSCRVCATEHPLEAIGTCTRCFGPLDPVYDWDLVRSTVHARATRSRARVDLALRRPAPRRGPGGGTPRAGLDAARPGAAAGRGARGRRALAQARHGEPDPLVQGPRRRGGRAQGAGARASTTLSCSSTGNLAGAVAARAAAEGLEAAVFVPADLEPEKLARGRGVRADDLRRRRTLRPLLAALGRAVVRAAVGLRQRQPPLVLRRGLEDDRLRDRRAARLARARRRRDPDRLRCAVPQGRAGLRGPAGARARRRPRAASGRRPGGRLRAGRDRLPRGRAREARAPRLDRALARDRQPRGRRLRRRDGAATRAAPIHAVAEEVDRREHGAPRADDGRVRRDGDRRDARARSARRSTRARSAAATASSCSSPATG